MIDAKDSGKRSAANSKISSRKKSNSFPSTSPVSTYLRGTDKQLKE
jgi:hypothetical protein